MIVSVEKYKGFYVARYELGLDSSGNPVSKNASTTSGITTADSNNSTYTYRWYGLYKKCKEMYQSSNTSSNVTSTMIWGSQYDAMMNWMSKTGKKIGKANEDKKNKSQVTGQKTEDQINKVYDLYGCHWDWSLEALYSNVRTFRRGNL